MSILLFLLCLYYIMKSKKLIRRKHNRRTRKVRNMKGGDRPDINILKNINLFSRQLSHFIDPLHGCAYVELEMIDNLYNLYRIPANEPFLNKYETQHNRLIDLIFHNIDGRIEPIHHLRDNHMVSIRHLAQFIILRLIWRVYPRDIYPITTTYLEQSKELKRITSQLDDNPRLSAAKRTNYEAKKAKLTVAVEAATIQLLNKLDLFIANDDEDSDDSDGVDRRVLPPLQTIMNDVENSYLKPLKKLIPLGEYTTKYSFHVLMALLWWKCPNKSHFREFYEVANEYLTKFIPNEKVDIPDDFDDTAYAKKDILKPVYNNPYKLFYCHYNIFKLSSGIDIKPIDYTRARVQGDDVEIEFTDCGETTIRNLIRIIAYNNETQTYDISVLERYRAIPELIAYFRKYITNKSHYTIEARNDWATLLTRLEGIVYVKGVCEIKSNYANILKILRHMFADFVGIEGFNTEHIRIVDIANPAHNALFEAVLPNLKPEKQPFVRFIIVIKDIPRFVWLDSGLHAHIESLFAKPEENAEVMDYYTRHAIRKNELLIYADSMAISPSLMIHNYYLNSYNPYLLTDSNIMELIMISDDEYEIENLLQKHVNHGETRLRPIWNPSDMSILMKTEELKKLATYIVNPRNYGITYNFRYNAYYVMEHTDLLRAYTQYDEEHKIVWMNKTLFMDEMELFIKHGKLSPNLSALSFRATEYDDEINQYIPKFPRLKALQVDSLNIQLEEIETLFINRYDKPYILGDSLKTLIVRSMLPDDIHNIPHSVETLIIMYLQSPIPTVLPNLKTLQIVSSQTVITDAHVPSTVRTLELGLNYERFIRKYPYFAASNSQFSVYMTSNQIHRIPDNVKTLYYETYYIDVHIDLKRIQAGAFPSLDKLVVPMGTDDDRQVPQQIDVRVFRHLDKEEIILENAVLIG
jgi:hypothetical protein